MTKPLNSFAMMDKAKVKYAKDGEGAEVPVIFSMVFLSVTWYSCHPATNAC